MSEAEQKTGTPTPPPPPPPAVPFAVSAAGAALGRRGRGIAKQFTAEEIQRRREQMLRINEAKAAGSSASKVEVAKGTVKRVEVARGVRRTNR